MSTVMLGDVPVGDDHPPVFVAEVGTFFNKDIELAKDYLRRSVEAGAPVFKTEILHSPEIILPDTGLDHEYEHAQGTTTEDYRSLIERKVVPLEDYAELFSHCDNLGVPYVASVYDRKGIDFLEKVGAAGIKIARQNINNIPLLRYAASTELPVILDAGGVYLDEVSRAVREIRNAGAKDVVVNHHPGANPAAPGEHHMRVMRTYKEALDLPVGLSCHYRGDEILYLAVGMGADVIEKGVVDDPDREEQDLVSASPLSKVDEILEKIQACWEAKGKPIPQPEEPRDLSTRSSIVSATRITEGDPLTEHNLRWAWPPVGIGVEHWDEILGRTVTNDVPEGEPLVWSDIGGEPNSGG